MCTRTSVCLCVSYLQPFLSVDAHTCDAEQLLSLVMKEAEHRVSQLSGRTRPGRGKRGTRLAAAPPPRGRNAPPGSRSRPAPHRVITRTSVGRSVTCEQCWSPARCFKTGNERDVNGAVSSCSARAVAESPLSPLGGFASHPGEDEPRKGRCVTRGACACVSSSRHLQQDGRGCASRPCSNVFVRRH